MRGFARTCPTTIALKVPEMPHDPSRGSALGMLLGDLGREAFLRDVFGRQPYARPGGASPLLHLGTWNTIEEIWDQPAADVLLARRGEPYQGQRPRFAQARSLHAEGFTLAIRHAECHHAGLKSLADDFHREFLAPVNIHVYCTPGQQYGFGWHYDAEDVFILQTQGRKEYSLRKNTVHPWPVVESIPADMQFQREIMPVIKCQLAAGDWLYIPAGYWHVGQSCESSISLALGVMTTTALEVLDFLRQRLVGSLVWRQRLPVPPVQQPPTADADLAWLFGQLANDLGRELARPELAGEFWQWRRQRLTGEVIANPPAAVRHPADAAH
jgi:ribosomal protein L16 Arg81 hydroxylase